MLLYALRRVLGAIPLLVGVSFLVFVLLHIAPGDPAELLAGGRHLDAQTLQEIRREFHLNDPFFVQYGLWLSDAVRGNFGQSIVFREAVIQVIAPRIPPTLELGGFALVLVAIGGLGLGTLAAVRQGSLTGRASAGMMLAASTFSPYVSGIVLITVFGVILGWFPILGLGGGGLDRLYHLTLPAIALAMSVTALVGRTCQTSLSQVLGETFIEAARSRGFSERRIVIRHGLRNALLPVVTVMGVSFGYLIVGAVLVEYTFGLAGLGSLLVEAVQYKDFATVQAVTLIFATAFVAINLGVDLIYALADPRVRLSTRSSGG
jgi:peptide/nickel transport system permease protein